MLVESSRLRKLNNYTVTANDYVLYWMQSSQRLIQNPALSYAIKQADKLNQPLLVAFGLIEYPEAKPRHYRFMLEGLVEVQEKLLQIGAGISFKKINPVTNVSQLSENASLVIIDRGYLGTIKDWYTELLRNVKRPIIQVESNVVVPVEETSQKEEYAARTIRSKIEGKFEAYLKPVELPKIQNSYRGENSSINLDYLKLLKIERHPGDSSYTGGYSEARRLLDDFVDNKLDGYHELKNDPTLNHVSHMSPYLHFGQISPVEIALSVRESDSPGGEAYLEELIVRRELAVNFVNYNQDYDKLSCLPEWCIKTLNEHRKDPREYIYTLTEFEKSETHDPYWNAAQTEMVRTGKMQGYMRMYWGKKIIEWTKTPEDAYRIALYLNNKYELDGRDPNGYAGVAWCFGKHDRPWKERPVFGKIRYMNDKGLERKFKIRKYAKRWVNP